MSPFADDRLELELRSILQERAEEIAARARTPAQMAAEITPRLRSMGARSASFDLAIRLAGVALIVLLLAALVVVFGSRPSRPPATLLLAVELPLSSEPGAPPIVNAVRLAISAATPRDGLVVELPPDGVFDDAAGGTPEADAGAANMRRIAADPRFVAVIGPYNTFVAESEIPIANAAGILECSPTNTGPGLTQGDGASQLRPRPDRPTYVRVASTDDAAAEAAATLLIGVLDKRRVFVVSTVTPWAGGRADTFLTTFDGLGGAVAGRGSIGDGGDPPGAVAVQVEQSGADAVFFDGPGADGGAVLAALSRTAPDLPFVGLDTILDGPRSQSGSFLNAAGPDVRNAYGVFPAGRDTVLGPRVEAAYQAAYGQKPGNAVLAGHACASLILQAIGRIDAAAAGPVDWREAIRADVTTPGRSAQTAIGTIAFDANGDARPQRLSIFRADPATGDWTFSQLLEPLRAG